MKLICTGGSVKNGTEPYLMFGSRQYRELLGIDEEKGSFRRYQFAKLIRDARNSSHGGVSTARIP